MSETTRHESTACPHCYRRVDAATNLTGDGDGPGPGSPTVCLYCENASVFDESMRLRKLTAEDEQSFRGDGTWAEIEKIVKAMRQARITRAAVESMKGWG